MRVRQVFGNGQSVFYAAVLWGRPEGKVAEGVKY